MIEHTDRTQSNVSSDELLIANASHTNDEVLRGADFGISTTDAQTRLALEAADREQRIAKALYDAYGAYDSVILGAE